MWEHCLENNSVELCSPVVNFTCSAAKFTRHLPPLPTGSYSTARGAVLRNEQVFWLYSPVSPLAFLISHNPVIFIAQDDFLPQHSAVDFYLFFSHLRFGHTAALIKYFNYSTE